ncbi:hypothetical protein ACF08M_36280 [Streptomyces sp. NPDC015032]|uniref:hypothetical protein n=1 Tax=Streptomyces sp. NPDC015032 TaxID=3364937 RepID=UPI0036F7B520
MVQLSTLTAYQLMVAGNAIAFLVAAAILFHLPPVTPVTPVPAPLNRGPVRRQPEEVPTARHRTRADIARPLGRPETRHRQHLLGVHSKVLAWRA